MTMLNIIFSSLTLIVLFLTFMIYYQLLKAEKESIRLSLYDKRYAVYMEIRQFLMKLSQGPVEINEFIDRNSGMFLFDKADVFDYINELIDKALLYKNLCQEIDAEIKRVNQGTDKWYTAEEWDKKCTDHSSLSRWFYSEYCDLHYRFMKYLDFRNIEQ